MSSFLNFAETLEKQLRKDLKEELFREETTVSSSENTSTRQPKNVADFWAFTLGQIHLNIKHNTQASDFSRKKASSSYARKGSNSQSQSTSSASADGNSADESQMDSSTTTASAPQVTAEPIAAHLLNADQTEAFQWMNTQGAALTSHFTRHDLRKNFRGLALKLHPDHGGEASVFMQLQDHFLTLNLIFSTND